MIASGILAFVALVGVAGALGVARSRRQGRAFVAEQAALDDAGARFRLALLRLAGQLRWDEPGDDRVRTAYHWLRDRCPSKGLERCHYSTMDSVCAQLLQCASTRPESVYRSLTDDVVLAQRRFAVLPRFGVVQLSESRSSRPADAVDGPAPLPHRGIYDET
ncbi:MAG: hypothetical protein HKN91_13615 [Acidimicrobiia bacterium]|nr:hypothetical protein [Acidimicrobiia bacterium]